MLRKLVGRWGLVAIAVLLLTGLTVVSPRSAYAMHIMEGYLSLGWAIFWWIVAIPFWVVGFIQIRKIIVEKPEQRMLLGLSGGLIFVLSALKIPSVTGSSSHPTGTGIGTILFGPFVVSILGTIALVFQATLLAHGGYSTLGANAVSMAIAGPLAGWGVWLLLKRTKVPMWLKVFLTVAVCDLFTYVVTATQLALAFPDPVGGFVASWAKFLGVFAVTQIPIAIAEGILGVLIFHALQVNATSEMTELGLMRTAGA